MNYYQKIIEALSGASRAYKNAYKKAKKPDSKVWDRYDAQRKEGKVPTNPMRDLARRGLTGNWADKRTAKVRKERHQRDGLRP